MSRKQSSLKTVMALVVAAIAITLANLPQSLAQSPTTEDSTTAPAPESGQNKQPIYTLSGHTGDIASVAFSPDGQTLVSGSFDKTIKLWNLKTGKLSRTLTGHSDFVHAVAISPDGQTIVSGGGGMEVNTDKTIRLWNLKTGKLLRTLAGHSQGVSSLVIAPDGQTLVSASYDKTIKLWNLKTGKLLYTLTGHSSWVRSVAISPDGQTIVSSGGSAENNTDNTIKLWNLKTGKLLHTLSGHSRGVIPIGFKNETISQSSLSSQLSGLLRCPE
jgi:WD40 repeat protein